MLRSIHHRACQAIGSTADEAAQDIQNAGEIDPSGVPELSEEGIRKQCERIAEQIPDETARETAIQACVESSSP